MKRLPLILLLTLVTPLWSQPPDTAMTLDQILTAGEKRDFDRKSDLRPRMSVFKKALERLTLQVSRETKAHQAEAAVRTLQRITSLCSSGIELALNAPDRRVFRSKAVKKLEIQMRRTIEDLQDLKIVLPFEYSAAFESAMGRLEEFREVLLDGLFEGSLSSRPGASPPAGASSFSGSATRATTQRLRSSVQGDKFTDEELEEIRDAQEIVKRVEVLLGVCQARLDEVTRRLANLEWTRKEPNPLEFFTFAEMMRGYHRALESIMINIDEKARLRRATEKEIKKALKKLNVRIREFIPQLEPLKKLAVETEDRDLFLELRKADQASQTALKGSQLGLGAPAN